MLTTAPSPLTFTRDCGGISYQGEQCQRNGSDTTGSFVSAVRIVDETGKPNGRDFGVNEGMPGSWSPGHGMPERSAAMTRDDLEELKRMRVEVAELRM
jgi:hypothetical protein